jgi:acyl-CoA synthetase (AMP-forming)/AMP-acid ligase II
MNLVTSAQTFPENTALRMDDQVVTYARLDEATARLLGEEIGAAVVLKPEAQASPEELSEFVRSRLAAYKYPRQVWLMESLPKGPTGKILRREVTVPSEAAQT